MKKTVKIGKKLHEVKVGKKFGMWTVLDATINKEKRVRRLLCRCACGYEALRNVYDLYSGKSKGCISCCLKRMHRARRKKKGNVFPKKVHPQTQVKGLKPLDLRVGMHIGKREVVGLPYRQKMGNHGMRTIVVTRCECGYTAPSDAYHLINNKSLKCKGCASRGHSKYKKRVVQDVPPVEVTSTVSPPRKSYAYLMFKVLVFMVASFVHAVALWYVSMWWR